MIHYSCTDGSSFVYINCNVCMRSNQFKRLSEKFGLEFLLRNGRAVRASIQSNALYNS
jgi:hypothetical protein